MKIGELIKLNTYDVSYMKKYGLTKMRSKYFKEKGYVWNIPCHSMNESVLLNNYEKDCVVAYIKNKYLTIFLIKIVGEDNFAGFVWFDDFLNKLTIGTYRIERIRAYKRIFEAIEQDNENLTIVDKEQFDRFKKLVILNEL